MSRLSKTWEQLRFLGSEAAALVGGRWWRIFTLPVSPSLWVLVSYRVDRAAYLLFGRSWGILRPLFFPLFLLFRVMGARCEIHYRADIGKGLRVLHPGLGVVVSAHAVIGENMVLVGGNCIGGQNTLEPGDIRIGNDVTLGANAVVLGPVRLGDRIAVGAGAVVTRDAREGQVLVGVPARASAPPDGAGRLRPAPGGSGPGQG